MSYTKVRAHKIFVASDGVLSSSLRSSSILTSPLSTLVISSINLLLLLDNLFEVELNYPRVPFLQQPHPPRVKPGAEDQDVQTSFTLFYDDPVQTLIDETRPYSDVGVVEPWIHPPHSPGGENPAQATGEEISSVLISI